ncbi:MAG TPA: glycosyltransferase family 4 protein [Candidatus Limnocylindrales bacterium]|nr:glycosyltransferase family 4 protein [Candidatus Limnocylindrales bacterium]
MSAAGIVPQRCVLVLPSTAEFDSRTYRIASTLSARGHDVTVLARLAPGLPASETHPSGYRILRIPVSAMAGLPGPLRAMARLLRRPASSGRPAATVAAAGSPTPTAPARPARRRIGGLDRLAAIALTVRAQRGATHRLAPPADVVHAMAYMGIPVGLDLGRRDHAPVIYDARDIYVDAANLARLPGPARRLFARIERGWARRAQRVVTVNLPYAEVMAERFGVPQPLVVLNCAYRREPPAERPRRFHQRLGLDPATAVVLYHGGFSRDRGIEQLIEALPAFAPAVLVLLGYGPLQAELERRAADPALAGRLHVLPAVPPTELIDWVASADVVAMPIQPTTLNHRLTTPNKLFEAMAAGVPIVASDLPGMAGIVREADCGVLVDPTDPAAIGAAIGGLLALPAAERAAIGGRGQAAHLATYNWEAQAAILLAEYGRLTGRPW